MRRPVISDHALLRFLERAGGLDVEGVRHALSASLARAAGVALDLSQREYSIRADGLVYIVVDNRVVTTYADVGGHAKVRGAPAADVSSGGKKTTLADVSSGGKKTTLADVSSGGQS